MDILFACHINVNCLSNYNDCKEIAWNLKTFNGEWKIGVNAGGSADKDKFFQNPQHKVFLESSKNHLSMIVSLSQEDTVKGRLKSDGAFYGMNQLIGFYVYYNSTNVQPNNDGKYDLTKLIFVNYIENFKFYREISMRFEIPPGEYIIVPCCFDQDKSAKYLLRVFVQSDSLDVNQSNQDDNKLRKNYFFEKQYNQGMTTDEINEFHKEISGANSSIACSIM